MNYSSNAYALQQKLQFSQNKVKLDRFIQHAQAIGVPTPLLQPVLNQEYRLSQPNVSFTLFNTQLPATYYQNQAKGYHALLGQLSGIITTAIDQNQIQAKKETMRLAG